MSSAVNLFLRQCVLRGGLPFNVEMPHYSQHTLDAMNEARRISRDPDVKGYTGMDELQKIFRFLIMLLIHKARYPVVDIILHIF